MTDDSAPVVALTRELVRLDTVDGSEDTALAVVAPLLEDAGFLCTWSPWLPGRSNLLATWRGGGRLVLSGHVDTVPVGAAAWSYDPHGGEIRDGRLFGRGSSDMKGGVAAMVLAATTAAREGAPGFTVALTAGEETGCGGARSLSATSPLPPDSVLIVGEATGNDVRFGHKGATWLTLSAHGRSAHGSRPELGVNAIEKIADAIHRLRGIEPGIAHPLLGARTTNAGTVRGGTQTNLVPDEASLSVDVRTVPDAGAQDVADLLAEYGDVATTLEIPSVWSEPETELAALVMHAVARVTGVRAPASGVSYFTDAAFLDSTRSRSFIIGPGDIDQPHVTDESVSIARLVQAVDIYRALIDDVSAS